MHNDPIPELRRRLANEILTAVENMNITCAAMALDLDPARLSDLRKGRFKRFSVERLIKLLAEIEHRVHVHVDKPAQPISSFRITQARRQRNRQDA